MSGIIEKQPGLIEKLPAAATDQPLSAREFAGLMAACGPFGGRLRLAVAVSGGADSLALCLLAAGWARAQGGSIVALTVDHGLRAAAAAEALQVKGWLKRHAIEHHILPWVGAKPAQGIQQAARAARYRLLGEWCAARGILYLLAAHHLGDQAETYALRQERGSGVDGLAGMAKTGRLPQHLPDAPLLLRPLLPIPKSRLTAYLAAAGQSWIEDPSNRQERYRRVKLRHAFAAEGAAGGAAEGAAGEATGGSGGLTVTEAALRAEAMQRGKEQRQQAIARFLAQHAAINPAGFASFAAPPFLALPENIAAAVLARLLTTLGGRIYPPRSERLLTLYQALRQHPAGGWTLNGCQVVLQAGEVLIFREAANCRAELNLRPRQPGLWDNRFRVAARGRLPLEGEKSPEMLTVRKLGAAGWRELVGLQPEFRQSWVPYPARLALPAFYSGLRLLAVPHIGYYAGEASAHADEFSCLFYPARGLI